MIRFGEAQPGAIPDEKHRLIGEITMSNFWGQFNPGAIH
jgi:hypothetical protein